MTEPSAAFTTEGHTPVLIEDWLPIRELGIESVRERAGMGVEARPPIAFLHVWWARAPLVAASGVILTSLLPMWSSDLTEKVPDLRDVLGGMATRRPTLAVAGRRPDEQELYRAWVLWLCGIWGDTVAADEASRRAKAIDSPLKKNPFTWKQAFKNSPSLTDLSVLHQLLEHRWGRLPRLLDPTAGGGSIPYSALRLGIETYANDLNPVAYGVLDASLRASTEFGKSLIPDLEKWGKVLVERCGQRLAPLYPQTDGQHSLNYIFVNTIACPRTGGPVPLAPNWWLDKSKAGIAALPKLRFDAEGSPQSVEFLVEHGPDFSADPNTGTISRGVGTSPWDGLVIGGDYIKEEAQAGRMWPTLYCVRAAAETSGRSRAKKFFRPPNELDFAGLEQARQSLQEHLPKWLSEDVVPTEEIPVGVKTSEPRRYGMMRWSDMFTDRQLFSHAVFVEEWRLLLPEVREDLGLERGDEVMTLLSMMQNKATNRGSKLSHWIPHGGGMMGNVFARHDLGFRWTFAEFEGGRELYTWCLSQILGAYSALVELLEPVSSGDENLLSSGPSGHRVPGRVTLSSGSAANLSSVESASIEAVIVDPPYYDNVHYAELADFFYVWERRTLSFVHPGRYSDELSNKEDEAIANVARFADSGRRKKELATFDYQQKMQAIFAECGRVLVDDGVMVVWFTHKRAEAWDTLATSMMEAGFTIEASWPVSTQQETSLNHARQNSAKSTIMLVCRQRQSPDDVETFFEDIEAEVRRSAREAVAKFEQEVGIGGVDLQLATYGPTLSVISRNWPVLSSEPDESGRSRRLRPEEALDVARQEVARLRMARLVGKDATFDPATDFWLMCWETFQAREFPYDEARKLALGVGYDVDDAVSSGLVKKKAGNVELVSPLTRGRSLRRTVDDAGRFDRLVDAVHFMLVTYRDDKLAAARTWMSDSGYGDEQRFIDAVQASVNAVPRVRSKKGLTLDEAVLLDDAVVGLFGDEVSLPVEAEEQFEAEQMTLGG